MCELDFFNAHQAPAAAVVAVGTPRGPVGLAISPDGKTVYVANAGANSVSVISTATNAVTARIGVGMAPFGVAVSADGGTVYVTNAGSSNVSVISTAGNNFMVTATIPIAFDPRGVAVGSTAKRAISSSLPPHVPLSSGRN